MLALGVWWWTNDEFTPVGHFPTLGLVLQFPLNLVYKKCATYPQRWRKSTEGEVANPGSAGENGHESGDGGVH